MCRWTMTFRRIIARCHTWSAAGAGCATAYLRLSSDSCTEAALEVAYSRAYEAVACGRIPLAYTTSTKRPAGFPMYPLARSCAFCERERDNTAGGDRERQLDRCSACRMTRYCGKACQRRDWARHNVVCRMVHSVKFENWDS